MKIHGDPATRFIISRVLWAARHSSDLTIGANGYRLRFYPTSISANMWCNPDFYREDEIVLKRWLRPGDNFVDVGANIGALTIVGSKLVGPRGRVFSLEPHPRTIKYLRGNLRFNRAGNVEVIHAAAGEKEGDILLTDKRADDQNSISTAGVNVPLRTLDSVLPDMRVRLLKIDVEGFELIVLKGATRILQQTDLVYFESWEGHFTKFGYGTRDVITFLDQHGFRVNCEEEHISRTIENLLAIREGAA